MKHRKINYKNLCSTHFRDNTVLVSSDDTSATTVIENLEYKTIHIDLHTTHEHAIIIFRMSSVTTSGDIKM